MRNPDNHSFGAHLKSRILTAEQKIICW